MVEVKNVTKKYGDTIAARDINMSVRGGELSVLLGPNGAGKSTLIKCISGLLRFDGEISICGHPNKSIEAKRCLGYIPEMPAMYNMLTVYEHMQFVAKAYKLSDWEGYGDELLERLELADKKDKLGQELSKGMQQKVSICCALLPRPKVAIFDEPLVGLDPHAIRELKTMLRQLKDDGCSLIISTHMIDSIEESWDTTHIMMGGEIAATRRRSEVSGTESLEDLFFSITEDKKQGGEEL